jgi:hypothetical protein
VRERILLGNEFAGGRGGSVIALNLIFASCESYRSWALLAYSIEMTWFMKRHTVSAEQILF